MTVRNHLDSSSHKNKKVKPYVRWDKETDEWECGSYVEENVDPLERINNIINKGKDMDPETLHAISTLVIALRNNNQPIADLPECIEAVDNWLTLQYEMLKPEYEVALQGHISGNDHICEDGY